MTTPLIQRPFPDIELVLIDLLDPRFAVAVTATPVEFGTAAVLQIERVGGSDDGVTDRPRVRIAAFDSTRPKAWALSRAVQAFLLSQATSVMIAGPNTAAEYPGGVQLDSVSTATPPRQIAEGGRNSRIVETIYQFGLRRPWWT